MANPEQPKVHCIVLSKLPHNLANGGTEWKLCKIFSTISKSNQRIHREKNATRKYKPILAFSVPVPLDTDRQTLNFNKGVVKDRLGFAVNCETVAALVDGVGDKGTQWVLTTNEFLKHISTQETLTVDTFYENEFDESTLEALLPSMFKLHSASNRTELVLAAPLVKHAIAEDKSMKLDATSKGPCLHGNDTKRETNTGRNINLDLTMTKSDIDLNRNHPVRVDSSSDREQENDLSATLKRHDSALEKPDGKPIITCKIKEEPLEYEYKPKRQRDETPVAPLPKPILKIKKERPEYNLGPECSIFVENPFNGPSKVIKRVKKEGSEPDIGVKRREKSEKKRHRESVKQTDSERGENELKSNCVMEPQSHVGEGGVMKNIITKKVQKCGQVTQTQNSEQPVDVTGSTENATQKLRQSDFVKNRIAVKDIHPKKKQVDNNGRNAEKEQPQLEQSNRPLSSSTVKTSNYQSKNPPPMKQHLSSTEQNLGVHKRPKKLPGTEKKSENQRNSLMAITKNSIKTGTGLNVSYVDLTNIGSDSNSNQNKRIPVVPDSQSSPFVKRKLPPDHLTNPKVVIDKLIKDAPKLKDFNISEESTGRNDGTGKENTRNTAPQSTKDRISDRVKSLRPPLKRQMTEPVAEQCRDIKRRKSTGELTEPSPNELQSTGRQVNPIPVKSISLSGRPESVKEANGLVQKLPQQNRLRDVKSPPDQVKRDDASKKGILKHSTSVDYQSNREGHTSTKKRISYDEYKTTPKDSTMLQRSKSSSIPEANPRSDELDLLGSINTFESYLFYGKSKNEQLTPFNAGSASLHSGVNMESAPHQPQVSDTDAPKEVMSSDRSISHRKRSVVPSIDESFSGDIKRCRTVDQGSESPPEINLYGHVNYESNGGKKAEKDRRRLSCDEDGWQHGQLDKSTGKRQSESLRIHEKNPTKERSNVTLLVGDSMLQHIQPEKFFKNKHVIVKAIPEARVDNVSEYITKFVQDEKPNDVILHIGTNDLQKDAQDISAQIESLGKLITKTYPSVAKFAISSIIQRRDDVTGARPGKESEVNKTLRCLQSKRGWDYIDNDNLDPEVHICPDGVHLNASGIEAFAMNIGVHLGCGSWCENTSSSLGSMDQFHVKVKPTSTDNSATSSSKCVPDPLVPRNGVVSDAKRPIILLVGDSMLESVEIPDDLSNKQVKPVVIPYARVDTFGDTVIDLAKHHKVDEVILHVGSNDLNDNTLSPKEIAFRIEQVGVDLEKICPSISRITVSGTISRNHQGADAVNTLLNDLQSKHGWCYISHYNVAPNFQNRPFDVKLGKPDEDIFQENILRYLQDGDLRSTDSIDTTVSKTQGNGDICPSQECSGKDRKLCVKSDTFKQSIDNHHRPLCPENQQDAQEKAILLIGDLMLKSIIPGRLSRKKKVEMRVVPDARVDNIGKVVSKFAKNPNIDEVILHVGSNDLKDDVYDQNEIASRIETIGMQLEKTCPNITAFTISGVISTFKFKRSNCRILNEMLNSFKMEHGWGYINNDNLYPTFHMIPFGNWLNHTGTSLFASNIIKHLRSAPCNHSQRNKTASRVEKRHEKPNEDSSKGKEEQQISSAHVVTTEEAEVPPKDVRIVESKAVPATIDTRPQETDRCEENHGKSKTNSATHFKQNIGKKGKPRKQMEYNINPLVRGVEIRERPHPRESWRYSQDQSRYRFSSDRQSVSARLGRPPQDGKPKMLYPGFSGCHRCGGFDHKIIDCPH